MKFLELLKSARWWIGMLLISIAFLACANMCSRVDNGADLNPTERLIREKVVTSEVIIDQVDGAEYLVYQGEPYELPQDKTILLSESIQDYEKAGQKKVVTDIFFDEGSNDFVLREQITTRSYKIEKLKREKSRHAAWSYLGALMMGFVGAICVLCTIGMFIFWTEDLNEFRRRRWISLYKIADWFF